MRRPFRPRFFLDGPQSGLDCHELLIGAQAGTFVRLAPEDARHARTVLRSRPGDLAEVVFEPWRLLVPAEVESVGKEVVLRLFPPEAVPPERLFLALIQALPQPSAVDTIVEKGTEVGVDLFVFVPAEGSPALPVERLHGRLARWRRVAGEAAKQSKQLARPSIQVVASMPAAAQALEQASAGLVELDAIAPPALVVRSVALEPTAAESLRDVLQRGLGDGPSPAAGPLGGRPLFALWVGPEGGWTAPELTWFAAADIPLARLGRRILKAETAGPVAAALVRFSGGDW